MEEEERGGEERREMNLLRASQLGPGLGQLEL
jgi:hypothetical protein